MRLFVSVICISIAVTTSSAFSAVSPAQTLCKADELVVFSCPTKNHIASICASKDISKTSGFMQYRFGRLDHADMVYPDVGIKPADVFTAGTMMFSGGGGDWLRFSKGAFSYTIFSAFGKWSSHSDGSGDAAGVAVRKNGKEFANFPCRSPNTSKMGRDFFDDVGLKLKDPAKETDEEADEEFEIPQAFLPKSR